MVCTFVCVCVLMIMADRIDAVVFWTVFVAPITVLSFVERSLCEYTKNLLVTVGYILDVCKFLLKFNKLINFKIENLIRVCLI